MDGSAIRRYWRAVVRQWWWLLILSMAIPAAVSYRLVANEPELYQARVTMLVGLSVFEDPDPDRTQLEISRSLASAYAELARQRPVVESVIERLGLTRSPEDLLGQIKTEITYQAQLLAIVVTDTDPQAAALIANTLADELISRSPSQGRADPQQQAFVQSQLTELQTKIVTVSGQIEELSAELSNLTSAAEIQETEEQISALEEVRARYQSTYASLLSVSSGASTNALSVFDPAAAPEWPLPRRTKLVVGLAGAAGVVLALVAVALLEFLDTSLKWEGEGTQRLLGLPVLSAVPQVSKHDSVVSSNYLSPMVESIRGLRSNLSLTRPGRPYRTLLVTSSVPGEGKSLIVSHLAVALAATGIRVIAVDADLRRPTLHERFARPNEIGLTELLADYREWPLPLPLQETDFESLRLLTAGRPPLDPTALLGSPRLAQVLGTLSAEADVVLVDSPPVTGPPDASIVAGMVDGTILVAAVGLTRQEKLQQAISRLSVQQGVTLVGVVVNRVKEAGGYYYQYYKADNARGKDLAVWIDRWVERIFQSDGCLTLSEAASRLGISRSRARRWCTTGRLLASRRWHVVWRVDPAGVERMLEIIHGMRLQFGGNGKPSRQQRPASQDSPTPDPALGEVSAKTTG